MAEAADHPDVQREYPVIAQSLQLAASQQIRNMASARRQCSAAHPLHIFPRRLLADCNKRNPGSGCAALDGFNRAHAVLGTSEQCIATYPGDFAQALIALDATVDDRRPERQPQIPFAELHRQPGDTPDIETSLQPGELITAFTMPAAPGRAARCS